MFGGLLDNYIFTSRWLKPRTKWIVFGIVVFAVVETFWWFRGVAFGIEGPIGEHKGLGWRKVCDFVLGDMQRLLN